MPLHLKKNTTTPISLFGREHTKEKNMAKPNTMRSKYLSIIIPVYNEAENIPLLHDRLRNVLEKQTFTYEIIYIDDGSKDGTFARLKTLTQQDEYVRVIQFRRNFGQTAAIAAGVTYSVGEILIFMDGDLQNDPIDIPRLLAKIDDGHDVVSGWRKNRRDAQWSRKFPSVLANKLISKVTGVHLNDYGCTLKAYRYEVFKDLRLYGEMHRFIPAYAALAGASITELPVNHHVRQFGTSKYGISRFIRVLLDLMTLKFLGSFGTKPLYAFGTVGISSLSVGISISVYTLSRRFFPRHLRIHRTPLLPFSLSFSGFGLLCIMIGLLAELLTRTYYEAQDKPTYVVKHFLSGSRETINDELLFQSPTGLSIAATTDTSRQRRDRALRRSITDERI
jgi:glycosyltransferase involved in cell wall biosynthesis